MRYLRVVALILLSVSIAAYAGPQSVVNSKGIGTATFGMTVAQFGKALREKFNKPTDPDEKACFYLASTKFPGIAFMFEQGLLRRIDVRTEDVSTTDGTRVGDLVSSVKSKYGSRLVDQPHFYGGPEDRYLTASLSSSTGIRFETHEGRIVKFYIGGKHQVQYVEGCL